MSYNSFRNDNNGPLQFALIQFRKSNNFASVANLDLLGQILWTGYDAGTSTYKSASYIYCQAVGAPAGNVPSELQFNTSFGTGTQLAMTIGQNGQVTINNPAANETTLFVTNNQTSANINLRTANATATNSPHIHFTRSRVGTADVNASDDLGRLEFRGFQGGTAIEAADIRAQAETVNGASVSGSLQFRTRPTTYAAIATRMNISANGNVTINAPVSGDALTATAVAGSLAASFAGSNAGGVSVTQSNGGSSSYQAVQSSVDAQPVYFNAFKNRAGGIIVANDVIYQLNGSGFADTNRTAALYRIFSTNVGANYVSGGHDWWTTSTAGTTGQRMVLNADGQVVINTPAAAGTALTVNGFNAAATYGAQFLGVVSGAQFDAFRALNSTGAAGSSCQIECSVIGQAAATGGDASLRFVNYGVRAVALGLDTSTDQFVIANSSALGLGNFLTYTASNNQINLPLQASFLEVLTADAIDKTGNGTTYKLIGFTEIYDQSNSFNTVNGEFTAPATGRYMLTAQARVYNFTGATGCQLQLITSNRSYYSQQVPTSSNGYFSINIAVNADMDSGDIAYVQVQITGLAADTADIAGDGVNGLTWFSGCLLQ